MINPNEEKWSSYIIVLLLFILIGIQWYLYDKFNCPNCPTCPPIKECLNCPIPSSQGIINYINYTLIYDIENAVKETYNDIINKYVILDRKLMGDNESEVLIMKLKKQFEKKSILTVENIVYLNMSIEDKEKFKIKFNTGILPNPLFIVNGMDLIFGFQNDPSSLKIFINQSLF